MKQRVFISHQWRDKQIADRLARDLESFADVWMDYRSLRPGDPIQPTIDRALREVDCVLVVWTSHAAASRGVAAEIAKAVELGVRVVPCVFEYDAAGDVRPPLPPALAGTLGVDFHHYGSGLAQVADFMVAEQRAALPPEAGMEDHPGVRLMNYLRGYLSYLANYRATRGVSDDRAAWVDKIVHEIERYAASGGDIALVRTLLAAAQRSSVNDPEGIGMLTTRLEALLGETPSGVESTGYEPPRAISRPAYERPSKDELSRRIAQVAPAGAAGELERQVEAYIGAAPIALQALAAFAQSARSSAGAQVVQYLNTYLESEDDVVPDHRGKFGFVDDAWLILNTAFRLVESGLMPVSAIPLNWPDIVAADYVVRTILPPQALETLTAIMLQLLEIIAAEVEAYQPWFTPAGSGYAPTMAPPRWSGGTWEDQMNTALLGTGLSVDM